MRGLQGSTALGACLVVALLARGAAGDDRPHLKDAAADRHFQLGLDLYARKNFAEASRELSLANAIEPSPFLLYPLAQAERLAGHCPQAMNLYRAYLRSLASDAGSAAMRDAVNGFIDECRGTAVGDPPNKPPPPVNKPPPPPVDEHRDEQPRVPRWYTSPLGAVLAVGGLVGVGVGIGMLSAASRHKDDADHAKFLDDFEVALDNASRDRTIGGISLGVGFGLLGASALVYYRASRKHPPAAMVATDGQSVAVWGRF